MPKYKNGLARVGRVYHFHISQHGKTHHGSTRCESRATAEAWLRAYRERLALGQVGVQVDRPAATLAQVLEDWTQAMTGAAVDRHVANVRSALQLHLQDLLPLPLDQVTTERVETARTTYLNGKGRGHRPGQEGEWELDHTPGGANKLVQHLSSVLGWAVRRGVYGLAAVPFKLPRLKPQPAPEPVLWPELVPAFLAAAAGGHKRKHQAFPPGLTVMRVMLQLGLREDEALGMRWEWLDRRRRVYTVGQAKDRALREIPVPASLLDHLDRIMGPTTAIPRGLVLPAEDGAAHRAGFTAKPVQRCAELVGVPGLHPHRLRASFATTHFEAGTPLSQIQQMMGHEDPETTMRYIVQRPKDQAVAQENVARLMGFSGAADSMVIPSVEQPRKDS